jgi:hypothetical protein
MLLSWFPASLKFVCGGPATVVTPLPYGRLPPFLGAPRHLMNFGEFLLCEVRWGLVGYSAYI